MKINPIYVVMVLGLLIVVPFTRQLQQRPTSFYGIAENQDLDLSLAYPVVVQRIAIREGQAVEAGQLLAVLERKDIPFQEASLEQDRAQFQAKKQELLARQTSERKEIEEEKAEALFQIENKLTLLRSEQTQNTALLQNLNSTEGVTPEAAANPEIAALEAERATLDAKFLVLQQNLNREIQAELKLLETQQQQVSIDRQEIDRQSAELELRAPVSGVIGTVNFIAGEQVGSRETILNIYQLHPNQVTTYIPEGQLTDLPLGTILTVSSLQTPDYQIEGTIISLGNKIRELPVRMRRDPAVQAWGREVLLEITSENQLIQGERVLVEQITE
ncbi:MAG: HlyD family efflux transporter periplasmic adaptor subunit [Bacteroidota bacterium]